MKKKLCTLLMILGLAVPMLAMPATAGAVNVLQACNVQGAGNSSVCQEANSPRHGSDPFTHTIKVVLNILSIVVGVAAVFMLMFSGMKMIWAQGDAAGVKSAREGVIGALVGLAVAALAQSIVVFVLNRI